MKDKYRNSDAPRLTEFLDKLDTLLIKEVGEAWDYTFDIEDDWIHLSLHLIDPDSRPQPMRLIDFYG